MSTDLVVHRPGTSLVRSSNRQLDGGASAQQPQSGATPSGSDARAEYLRDGEAPRRPQIQSFKTQQGTLIRWAGDTIRIDPPRGDKWISTNGGRSWNRTNAPMGSSEVSADAYFSKKGAGYLANYRAALASGPAALVRFFEAPTFFQANRPQDVVVFRVGIDTMGGPSTVTEAKLPAEWPW